MKSKNIFILFFILFSFLSCANEEPIRWGGDTEEISIDARAAQEFWIHQGYDIQESLSPNLPILLNKNLEVTALFIQTDKRFYRSKKTRIEYSLEYLNLNNLTREAVLAHEFGHALDFNHTQNCPDIMNLTWSCMLEDYQNYLDLRNGMISE